MPGFNIPYTIPGCPSIPSFRGRPSHVVETARKHRYVLEVLEPFGSRDDGILVFLEKCTRPSPEFDKILIHSAQSEIPRPGKTHWKEVEFTFYEKCDGPVDESDSTYGPLVNTSARLIYEWWAASMMDVESGLHRSPSEYLKNCSLAMLDGNGDTIWQYDMYDAWPMKVSPSDLSYSDTDIATVSVLLAYSRAREHKGG